MGTKPSLVMTMLLLAACTKTPASVAPSTVSDVGYENWTCEQMATEQMRLSVALTIASPEDQSAGPNDTERPGGQRVKYDAIVEAMRNKGCTSVQAIIDPSPQRSTEKTVKTAKR
jgi:hypothetical protein